MKCPKCGKVCKSTKGVQVHQSRSPECGGKKIRKPKRNFEHELMSLQVRCDLAAKLLLGAI